MHRIGALEGAELKRLLNPVIAHGAGTGCNLEKVERSETVSRDYNRGEGSEWAK